MKIEISPKEKNTLKAVFIALALLVAFSFVQASWIDNASTPTANNALAPINVGIGAQVKAGNLGVQNLIVNAGASVTGSVTAGSFSGNGASVTNVNAVSINNQNAGAMKLVWAGQGGQPTWLWGSNDGVNAYVWNPSSFNVATAGNGINVVDFYSVTNNGSIQISGEKFCALEGLSVSVQNCTILPGAPPGSYNLPLVNSGQAIATGTTWTLKANGGANGAGGYCRALCFH